MPCVIVGVCVFDLCSTPSFIFTAQLLSSHYVWIRQMSSCRPLLYPHAASKGSPSATKSSKIAKTASKKVIAAPTKAAEKVEEEEEEEDSKKKAPAKKSSSAASKSASSTTSARKRSKSPAATPSKAAGKAGKKSKQ